MRSPATWWTNARTVGARRPRRLARATSLVHLHSRTSHPRGCPCHRSSIHARSHRRSCSAVRSVSLSFLLVSPCSLSARSSRHCTESCTRVRLRAAMLLLRRRRMAGDDGLCLFSPHRALIAPRDFISPHFAIVVFCYCFSFFFPTSPLFFASSSSDLHAQIGLQDLQKSVDQFGADHPHTCLCPRLKGMSVRGGQTAAAAAVALSSHG